MNETMDIVVDTTNLLALPSIENDEELRRSSLASTVLRFNFTCDGKQVDANLLLNPDTIINDDLISERTKHPGYVKLL